MARWLDWSRAHLTTWVLHSFPPAAFFTSVLPDASFFDLSYSDPLFQIVLGGVVLLMGAALLLVGLAVKLRLENRHRQRRWRTVQARWEPLLTAVMLGKSPPEALHEQYTDLTPARQILLVRLFHRLARRVRGAELKALRRAALPLLGKVAAASLRQGPEHRAQSLQLVGLLGFDHYSGLIEAALDDDSPLVSMTALRILVRQGGADYADTISRALRRFPSWDARALAGLLAEMGPAVAPSMRRLLADPEAAPRLRIVAAGTLRRVADARAATVAVDVLRERRLPGEAEAAEASGYLFVAALRLLGTVAHADEHYVVLHDWCSVPSEAARATALAALLRLGRPPGESFLRRCLKRDALSVATCAAYALRQTGATEVLRDLAASAGERARLAEQVLSSPTDGAFTALPGELGAPVTASTPP
jgi:HEAT repeat protein